MPKMFHFEKMIDRYSVDFTVITETQGTYTGGRYVPGEQTETQMRGAVLPFKQSAIYQSGGAITVKDRVLWTKKPVPTPFDNTHVIYKGNKFTITGHTDNSGYANAYRYVLKWTEALSDA